MNEYRGTQSTSPLIKGGIERGVDVFTTKQETVKGKAPISSKKFANVRKLLWGKLRKCQLSGLRFRRQYGVFDYVVDFYCPEYKLAIEIIGDVHGHQSRKKADLIRKERIETVGIKVLFYTNSQFKENWTEYLKIYFPTSP